jgi:hypothetical protein
MYKYECACSHVPQCVVLVGDLTRGLRGCRCLRMEKLLIWEAPRDQMHLTVFPVSVRTTRRQLQNSRQNDRSYKGRERWKKYVFEVKQCVFAFPKNDRCGHHYLMRRDEYNILITRARKFVRLHINLAKLYFML